MRIVLSGTQCTGKSTLLAEIEKIMKSQQGFILGDDCTLVKEVVRTLMKERGITINRGADHKSQCLILEQHYLNCLRYPNMITDRGSIDAFAYATWDYMHGNYTLKQHLEHKRLFELSLPFYKALFYLPIEFEIKSDGVRDEDKTYQAEVDHIYRTLIEETLGIVAFQLTGDVPSRVKMFFEAIAWLLSQKK